MPRWFRRRQAPRVAAEVHGIDEWLGGVDSVPAINPGDPSDGVTIAANQGAGQESVPVGELFDEPIPHGETFEMIDALHTRDIAFEVAVSGMRLSDRALSTRRILDEYLGKVLNLPRESLMMESV